MGIWWIKNKDVPLYKDLMHSEGHESYIRETTETCSLVGFTDSAMRTWVQCGYWYGGSPEPLSTPHCMIKSVLKRLLFWR